MPQIQRPIKPTGFRRLTPPMLDAANISARFAGLPEGMKRGHVLAAFKAAAPFMGLPTRLVHAIDWFFSLSQAIDWEPDSRPLVWPSAARQAEALGLTLSQTKRLNRRLIEAGLIVAVDGPGGERKGERHKRTGKILWGYGFDLSPLAVRMDEFHTKAAEGQARRKAYDGLRRRHTIARKSLRMILTTAVEQGVRGEWSRFELVLSKGAASWPSAHTDALDELAEAVTSLEQHVADAKAVLESAFGSVERHPEGRENAPLYNTNYKPTPESFQDTVIALERSSRELAQGKAHAEGGAADTARRDEERRDRGSIGKITPDDLVGLAPRLRQYLGGASPMWPDLVEAADWLRHDLHVSKSLWGDACMTLGRERAAIALAIVSTKPADHFKSGPAGYFSGMVRKAKAGELHLDRTIWAMRRKQEVETRRH